MRPVVETIGGREVELRLTFDALDQIAAVNPQFGEIMIAFDTRVWDWREVVAILSVALRPHKIPVADLFEERGITGCKDLAQRLWSAAMPKAEPGNGEAAAGGGGPQPSR